MVAVDRRLLHPRLDFQPLAPHYICASADSRVVSSNRFLAHYWVPRGVLR